MKYCVYYLSSKDGKSNCVVRSFCKLFNKDYDSVYNELCDIAKKLDCNSFNDVAVFENYLEKYDTYLIQYGKDIEIRDLELENGRYAVFCWDKKDFYHMVSIIDNNVYDINDKNMNLYTIKIYKQKEYKE